LTRLNRDALLFAIFTCGANGLLSFGQSSSLSSSGNTINQVFRLAIFINSVLLAALWQQIGRTAGWLLPLMIWIVFRFLVGIS